MSKRKKINISKKSKKSFLSEGSDDSEKENDFIFGSLDSPSPTTSKNLENGKKTNLNLLGS